MKTHLRVPFPARAGRCLAACLLAALGTLGAATMPGTDGGLVVIVDPSTTEQAVALARQGRFLVALLEDDPEAVTSSNDSLAAAKVYPLAQCHPWLFPRRLPFRTNSVNVVILRQGLHADLVAEAERVVAPGHGVVWVEQGGAWQERRKPRPNGMATWYGFAADGGNSFYSPDRLVGPVNSVQCFHGGNRLRRSHPFVTDDRVLVQSAGNIEGRDPFSGVLRWRTGARGIFSNIGFLSGGRFWWLERGNDGEGRLQGVDRLSGAPVPPIALGKFKHFMGQDHDAMSRYYRVVSDGTTIYATGGERRITAHDAASGRLLWETSLEPFVECLAVSGDLLVAQLSSTDDSPREVAFGWNCNIAEAVVGLDPATGKVRWRNEECRGRPSHNLLVDAEKVVVCSYLFPKGVPTDKRSGGPWYQQRQFLQVVERDDGATRFVRQDFADIRGNESIQTAAVWPGRIGVMKDNNLAVFDARDGKLVAQYAGGGYHLAYPAVSPEHFWTGNGSVRLDAPGGPLDPRGFDLAFPPYNHRNMIANGMLYSPSHLSSVSSRTVLGSAPALILREPQDFQALPWDDARRRLGSGKADWSAPAPTDWPTLRGDAERGGWLPGPAPVPTALAWEHRPAGAVDGEAARLLGVGWRQHPTLPGRISQPVADGTRVLVVLPDEHVLVCLDRTTGNPRWSRRFDGRLDTAPTLAGETGFLGCGDGTVCAVDLADGEIRWRFRAAPGADLVMDHDQVASLYPVPSAPVLHGGALYASAGRHSQLDQGIAVWKLDPADGRPLGRVVLDAAWAGPGSQEQNWNRGHPGGHPRLTVNDVLQMHRGRLSIAERAMIDPATMSVAGYVHDETVQDIAPERGGIGGGTTWLRPRDQSLGYRLAGVRTTASHPFTGTGMILNRDLGLFAMTMGRGRVVTLPLGFDAGMAPAAIDKHAKTLLTGKLERPHAFAARGDLLYYATVRDGRLHLFVVDRKDPGTAVAEVAIPQLDRSEEVIIDGIAITADMVFLTTTGGRILAFGAAPR